MTSAASTIGPVQAQQVWEDVGDFIGNRVFIYDELDSTNSYAAANATQENAGNVIIARNQTAGRGQYTRSWITARDAGVWMTVVTTTPPSMRRPVILAAWASVCVCEVIRQYTGLEATIKWPNDVLLHAKKVAGILIESHVNPRSGEPLVFAGIGLNVLQPQTYFDANDLPFASSLACTAKIAVPVQEIARLLIRRLDRHYWLLCNGDMGTLESRWKARIGLLAKLVTVKRATEEKQGILVDMAFDGIQLANSTGVVESIIPEAIQQLRPAITT